MLLNKNTVLSSTAIVTEKLDGSKHKVFLINSQEDGKWEMPKVLVRKGESSVRAALRLMGEKGGMSTRILEEVGRTGGVTTVNGKTLPQRNIYYLMLLRSKSTETLGFEGSQWVDYAKAIKLIQSKKEKDFLKASKDMLIKWLKDHKYKKEDEEEVFL